MKKVKGIYILSNTDRKRIKAHTRALAREAAYDGHIEAWFDSSTGKVDYYEFVGSGGYMEAPDDCECICWEECSSWS